jgi:arginine utilization regulatory protein
VVNSIHNVYPIFADEEIIGAICYVTDYKNIEQTFATVGKPKKNLQRAKIGGVPVKNRHHSTKNGTRFTFDDIIGCDPSLLTAVKSAKLAADSPSPIMIYGETGTGKELFAQAIHNRSARRNKPYVAINCAAIPENLLEGILFGTSRGAFTGATDKAGLIESAGSGTLFLDEVNSMSPGLQAKLLRVLQERKVRRVGAAKEVEVDLKVISSVNILPHLAIDAGSLRADLFYRLAVVFLQIPPLRDRMGDLNPLIACFLGKTSRRLGTRASGIDIDVMDLFEQYDWPGNVRELEHVIEGAMNMLDHEETIRLNHLATPIRGWQQKTAAALSSGPRAVRAGGRVRVVFQPPTRAAKPTKTLTEMKADQEMAAIDAALTHSNGCAAVAARSLGISPQLLHYKLKRFGIDRLNYRSQDR